MGQSRPLCVYFRSLQQHFYRKIVNLSGIRTQIVKIEGKHSDLLTTTSTPNIHREMLNILIKIGLFYLNFGLFKQYTCLQPINVKIIHLVFVTGIQTHDFLDMGLLLKPLDFKADILATNIIWIEDSQTNVRSGFEHASFLNDRYKRFTTSPPSRPLSQTFAVGQRT